MAVVRRRRPSGFGFGFDGDGALARRASFFAKPWECGNACSTTGGHRSGGEGMPRAPHLRGARRSGQQLCGDAGEAGRRQLPRGGWSAQLMPHLTASSQHDEQEQRDDAEHASHCSWKMKRRSLAEDAELYDPRNLDGIVGFVVVCYSTQSSHSFRAD